VSVATSTLPQRWNREDELLQIFLDRAIHDLRSSARQIGTSAGLLCERLQKRLEPEDEPGLRRLRAGVAEMNLILTGMSSYAVALSAANYTFRSVNLKTVLGSALAHLNEPISATGATITHHDLPEVTVDADRLSEVLQHLIGNALKYRTEEPPRIELRAKREQEHWLLAVRDNGIGLEPRYWGQVFAPFYRLHGPEIPGVGLGLTISRRILETHQGEIWIESQKGSGTTCFFTLLAADGDRPPGA
jgi:two-component system, chemotaxis family, sensor kinase Cph1